MLNSKIWHYGISFLLLLISISSFATPPTPEGKWAARSPTLGDKPIGIVKISIVKDRLYGELIEVLPLNGSLEKFCKRSKRDLQVGPLMMCDYHESDSKWIGGHIYESSTGKVYSSELKLSPDGNELYVTGESGLFSQTVTWSRVK